LEQAELFRAIVDICILIIAAEIATTIGVRLKLPRIIGPLIAGIIFGPYFLGGVIIGNAPIIEYNELVFVFGEIGAVLLLFQAGLHMRFRDLLRSGVAAFTIASVGVTVSFGVGLLISSILSYNSMTGLIIGGGIECNQHSY